nr:ABC transporter substrate-binding protein [Pyrinomonadaceae bacterium]
VKSRTLDDALAAISEIGRATGNNEQAQRLLNGTRAQLEDVRAHTQGLPRPRVLCVVDRAPGTLRDVYAATKESFIAQLIEIAGGEPIAPSAASGYGQISKEAILSLDPEIIIDMVQGAEAVGLLAEDSKAVWRELSEVEAVKANRVYPIGDVSVLHPSQFVGATARRFAELIHPEAFGRDTKR